MQNTLRSVLSSLLFLVASANAATDAERFNPVRLLQKTLRIDTTNPPGNEGRAARFWKSYFEELGIEVSLIPVPFGKDRINVIARVPGNGLKRPIILENHLDVVPADRARWKTDPFGPVIKDGKLFGRGAFDMKQTAVIQAIALAAAKKKQWPLERDLIFMGTVNEECPCDYDKGIISGVQWITEQRPELLRNAEFVINEGAYIVTEQGRRKHWDVAPAEKSRMEFTLRWKGKGRLTSAQQEEALRHLVTAVTAIRRSADFPIELSASTIAYFKGLAALVPPGPLASALSEPSMALSNPSLRAELERYESSRSLLRTTLGLTVLGGIGKGNTISAAATAVIKLTGKTPQWAELGKRLKARVGDLGRITMKPQEITLRTRGTSVHASDPPPGGGAAFELAVALDEVLRASEFASLWGKHFHLKQLVAGDRVQGETWPVAVLDSRWLPGQSSEGFRNRWTEIAEREGFELKVTDPPFVSGESSLDTALFQAIVRARDHFEAAANPRPPILTPVLSSTTDSVFFRRKGLIAYGFDPFPMDPNDDHSHGEDESVPVASLPFGARVLQHILQDLGTGVVQADRFFVTEE